MGNTVRIIIASCILAILAFLAVALFYPASLDMDSYYAPSSRSAR